MVWSESRVDPDAHQKVLEVQEFRRASWEVRQAHKKRVFVFKFTALNEAEKY